MVKCHFRGRENRVRVSANGVMARAWAILSETYSYPQIPFRSIGRKCFAWALRKAWAEAWAAAALAATSAEELTARVAEIDRELGDLKYRGFSTHTTKRAVELRELARPMVAEPFRRSLEADAFKLAA